MLQVLTTAKRIYPPDEVISFRPTRGKDEVISKEFQKRPEKKKVYPGELAQDELFLDETIPPNPNKIHIPEKPKIKARKDYTD